MTLKRICRKNLGIGTFQKITEVYYEVIRVNEWKNGMQSSEIKNVINKIPTQWVNTS